MQIKVKVTGLQKSFTLHQQQGVVLQVLENCNLHVAAGECVVLYGESGAGKSTLMRALYGNYLPQVGSIQIFHEEAFVEMVGATPRLIMALRKNVIGYVSQFLRTIPRVSCLDIVMEPALARGWSETDARQRAQTLLTRLSIPSRLWGLAPSTFSGGEQQRVNIARGLSVPWPVLLLDEPTASLDDKNRQVVLELIHEAKAQGAAIIGIFHDAVARDAVMDRFINLSIVE